MKFLSTTIGLVGIGIALLSAGCVAEAGDGSGDGPLGAASQAQIDPSYKSFTLSQLSTIYGSAWAGPVAGAPVEYWVTKSGYDPTATRTFSGASQTCAAWKRGVCGSGWAGATFYKATYVETPLDCAFPPGPCTPPVGAVSVLGAGSYRTTTSSFGVPVPFAWTYSTGTCEYWANNHPITTGLSTQSPLTPAYTSLAQFESSVCALSPAPTTFYTSYYEPVANFCSIPTC